MVRAIIFDCFGVLTTDGWLPLKEEFFSHDPAQFEEAGRLNLLCNQGQLPYEQFLSMVADMAQVPVRTVKSRYESSVPHKGLFNYIEHHLKDSYKLGVLSNASENWLDRLFTPKQLALFDAVSLSCDSGFAKPDERSYRTIAEKLNVPLAECVFVDDQQRFIEGAQAIGMPAIHYTGFEAFKHDIERLLRNKYS